MESWITRGVCMTDVKARHGVAFPALMTLMVITAGWWALALWPVPASVPEWVLRTRAACFGTSATGLPGPGGWILLIGEPIGMIGVLIAVWGDALRNDLRRLRASFTGQLALMGVIALVVTGLGAATWRVRSARNAGRVADATLFTPQPFSDAMMEQRYTTLTPPPSFTLTDQHGGAFSLDALRGQPVIVTFAYAHCETVCPTIVQDLKTARRTAGADDTPLVIVTLDPWRDVPSRLPTIAEQWQLGAQDRLLSGSVADVLRVLEEWEVSHSRDTRTGEVLHASAVVLLDREGRMSYRMSGDWQRAAALLKTL